MQIVPLSTARVNGLNLIVPEDAKEVIKSWDQRESTEKYIDSGVDDQVRGVYASILRVSMLTHTNLVHLHDNQLILNIPFTQSVRIRSILLKVGKWLFHPASR